MPFGGNQRNPCQGWALKAASGTRERDNSGRMGEMGPPHGSPRHNQCPGNMEQDRNTVILKAGGTVPAFYSAEHPAGIFGCEKLRLRLGQGGEGRTQEGG